MKKYLPLFLAMFAGFTNAANPPLPGDNSLAFEFRRDCGSAQPRSATCVAFVRGVRAGLTAQRMFIYKMLNHHNVSIQPEILKMLFLEQFCLPPGTSDAELAETAISYIDSSANQKGSDQAGAGFMVMMSIASKYRCTKEDFDAMVSRDSEQQ